jgi:CheY-like chemotaxis protein
MKSNESIPIKSILLVDDDQATLDLFTNLLGQKLDAKIDTSKYPSDALLLAEEYFYDLVILDVTMDYHGNPYGGFDLYKSLVNRYGKDSIIAYSKYITDELLKKYNYRFNFIEKDDNLIQFIDDLYAELINLRQRQTCFVAMPFDPKFDEIFYAISLCVENRNYRCVRVDKENFTISIVEKIFSEIRNCKLMIFLATDKNPNTFYEAGYALALEKEIVTVTDHFHNLPFDIRDRNAIEYKDDIEKLKRELSHKLGTMTLVTE